jgi:hypothetical protein
MPILTKILFVAVGLGLLAVPIALARWQGRPQHPMLPQQRRLEPIGKRRYDKLWIVDQDRAEDE